LTHFNTFQTLKRYRIKNNKIQKRRRRSRVTERIMEQKWWKCTKSAEERVKRKMWKEGDGIHGKRTGRQPQHFGLKTRLGLSQPVPVTWASE